MTVLPKLPDIIDDLDIEFNQLVVALKEELARQEGYEIALVRLAGYFRNKGRLDLARFILSKKWEEPIDGEEKTTQTSIRDDPHTSSG